MMASAAVMAVSADRRVDIQVFGPIGTERSPRYQPVWPIRPVARQGGRVTLEIKALRVPVSRSYVGDLRAGGWLE